jgi:hypothetical protein
MSAVLEEISVRYEGSATGTELWGMTQANFLVARSGRAATEVAVMLNDAAASFMAETLGQENTREFRVDAARVAGRLLVERRYKQKGHLEPSLTLSRATFIEEPELLDQLKAAVKA